MKFPLVFSIYYFSPLIRTVLSYGGGVTYGSECIDINGRLIKSGIHFVPPGPDACTLCECENGHAILCKSVLCAPLQRLKDCKSFQVGSSCCEYICLDDAYAKPDDNAEATADLGLRLIASAVSAIVSLSLIFFLVHRLRQRKIRGRQNRRMMEEQRNMGNLGYIAGSIRYLPGDMGCLANPDHIEFSCDSDPRSNYALWKPEEYFPRGEAPPPYEEAVAQARAEALAAMAASSSSNTVASTSVVDVIPTLSSLPPPPETPPPLQAIRSDAFYEDVQPSTLVVQLPPEANLLGAMSLPPPNTMDTSCICPEENDDFRSECENCLHSSGRYFEPPPEPTPPHETMTLQRRPASLTPNTANGYGTSLTLPTQTRRLREQAKIDLPAFSVQLPPPQWSDSSSSSRSVSPDNLRRSSVSSEGLGEASTHM